MPTYRDGQLPAHLDWVSGACSHGFCARLSGFRAGQQSSAGALEQRMNSGVSVACAGIVDRVKALAITPGNGGAHPLPFGFGQGRGLRR